MVAEIARKRKPLGLKMLLDFRFGSPWTKIPPMRGRVGPRIAVALIALARPVSADEVAVYAAASLTDCLQELARGFERTTGHTVVFNLGGSNDLARQIKAGAPADIFFSADKAQMDGLEGAGLVRAPDRVDVLSNVLVVVVPAASAARLR